MTVKIPTQLRAAAEGASEAQLEGATVQEVLEASSTASASCASESPTKTARLRRFVNVYLSGEDIRFLDGLADPGSRRR